VTDNDYGRGDDQFMRGAPDKKQPQHKGGCPLMLTMMVSLPAAAIISAVVLVKPFFRR
jgi:hypothetical protein